MFTITSKAKEFINKKRKKKHSYFILSLNTVGCSCSTDTNFILQNVDEYPKNMTVFNTDIGKIMMYPEQIQLLDKENIIDFNSKNYYLELRGRMSGLITANLKIM